MIRIVLAALAGVLAGGAVTALLLYLTSVFLSWKTSPRVVEVDHGVVYLTVVLGAGFGGLCGALAGLGRKDKG